MRSRTPGAPTIHEEINLWPAVVDLFTSVLMVFLLIFTVQRNLDSATLAAAAAQDRRTTVEKLLRSAYRDEVDRGLVSIEPNLNQLRVRFGDRVLFKTFRYELLAEGKTILGRLPGVITSAKGQSGEPLFQRIQIEGHTDDLPVRQGRRQFPRDNWDLSSARALEVLKFLSTRVQPPLPLDLTTANGRADTDPIGPDKAKNRRIEILIIFSDDEKVRR